MSDLYEIETEESLSSDKSFKRNTGLWISVLYFSEGFPYTLVNTMSIVFLKGLGTSNEIIGLTSFFFLPWVVKGFWSPLVDIYGTKRKWILGMEIICIVLFTILAVTTLLPTSFAVLGAIAILTCIAFTSATHDVAIDGFYLNVLNKDQQAFFVGVRNTAYRIAMLAGGGFFVFLAGKIAESYITGKDAQGTNIYSQVILPVFGAVKPLQFGWAIAFGLSALLMTLIYLFQKFYLPYPVTYKTQTEIESPLKGFFNAFPSYFSQDRIGWILAFVLLFRLGDALTFKMATPFLMDPIDKGGMNIGTAEIGILYGTIGVIFLIVGGLLGGFIIAKQGLRKWIWPMAIMQNTTNLLYWQLAMHQPSIVWAYVVNSIEQFTYGLGVAAYTVFLMRTVRPEYKASHYAITTGFMALGVLIPGLYSGYIQKALGYQNYFLLSAFLVIPGMLTIFFLPLQDPTAEELADLQNSND